jgi:hypothetical protein
MSARNAYVFINLFLWFKQYAINHIENPSKIVNGRKSDLFENRKKQKNLLLLLSQSCIQPVDLPQQLENLSLESERENVRRETLFFHYYMKKAKNTTP